MDKMTPNSRQPLYKPVYYLQRPDSPKNMINHVQSTKNLSLTMSIGANQSSNNYFPGGKRRQETNQQAPKDLHQASSPDRYEKLESDMKHISKENTYLKEENDRLKKELLKFKRESVHQNVRSSQKYTGVSNEKSNDLRGTIKKQTGQVRELKMKLDMVSKHCKMCEQIIDKMDERIKKLTNDQHKKTIEIDELRQEISKIDQLKEKTNSIKRLYNDLETKFNSDQLQWMKWKQNWLSEKEYYLNLIHQLQNAAQRHFS